jgi:hypothetical protein
MTSHQVLTVLPRLREDWQNHGQQNHLFGDMRSGQIEGVRVAVLSARDSASPVVEKWVRRGR